MLFLSTPSARRATPTGCSNVLQLSYFYPRPPRGGRLACTHKALQQLEISIHALREEGDLQNRLDDLITYFISIHAQ